MVGGIELRQSSFRLSPEPRIWSQQSGIADYPRVIYDSSGQRLVIPRRPLRIVSQTLGSDEVLFGVCAGDRLVGVSPAALDERYSNVADRVQFRRLPSIKSTEQVVQLRPDIVFVASYSSAEQIELLRAAGITVFRLANFDRIEGIMSNVRGWLRDW
jgi:iron complex transport system substrate-binding protein